jgi:hypothetical protein
MTECGLRIADWGLWIDGLLMVDWECGLRIGADCGLRIESADCGLVRIADW